MRILLLEDSEVDAMLTRRYLPASTSIMVVRDRKGFEEAVAGAVPPDLVIVDFAIPGWAGIDASVLVRSKWPTMPVLVLSGTITDEMIPALEEKEIDDVLLKDRPARLGWAIRKAIRDREREQAIKAAAEKALEVQRIQLVGEVSTGIAHDMRNMLTPIMGALHFFEQYIPHDKIHLLRNAQRSADRIVDMINRIMLFASGKNGHKENVSIRQVIQEFLQFLPGLLPHHIVTTSEISTRAVLALDPTLIRQILLNYCVNARDAGAQRLHIKADDVDLTDFRPRVGSARFTGKFCHISVEDDGSGVSPDILPKIFEVFFSTKELGKGTGLGLSTVRSIVAKFDGFVDVTSGIPQGSVFSAYLAIPN